jgi:myosin heavy subunit
MDDQARRQPKKTDHTMVEAKRWGNHSSLKSGAVDRSGFPSFTISHYNIAVTYSSEGFLDRNLALLTLISSLCFEVLLMDWSVRVPSTLL